MAEEKVIPTITLIEERPPEIDIITFYELLLGLPHTLEAYLAVNGGEIRNNIEFEYGEGGVDMKEYPHRIDYEINNDGDLIVFTDSDFEGDSDNYFLNADGELGYYYPEHGCVQTDFGTLVMGWDFTDPSVLNLTGDLIDSISMTSGSTLVGSMSATGAQRPQLVNGAAVFSGSQGLTSGSWYTNNYVPVAGDELFIVAKKPKGVVSYFLGMGRDWVFDGDNSLFGQWDNGQAVFFNSANSGAAIGEVQYSEIGEDGEWALFHWVNDGFGGAGGQKTVRVNGFLDYPVTVNTTQGFRWLTTIGNDPDTQLGICTRVKNGGFTYYQAEIKEILYYNSLTDQKRKELEVYLKYKHDLPVYVNSQ